MNTLLLDLRYALRILVKSPGFATVAILTLALGIGANTAIFSVVDAVLLRPLPFPKSDRLFQVLQTYSPAGVDAAGTSYLNFQDWERGNPVFEQLGAWQQVTLTLQERGAPQFVDAAAVTSGTFPMLGVTPLLGRVFNGSDDRPGATRVVLLGEGLWRSEFGGNPSMVGGTVVIDAQPFTVVGILPAGFHFPYRYPAARMWIPVAQAPLLESLLARRGGHYLNVVARLRPSVTRSGAQSAMQAIQSRLAQEFPRDDAGWGVRLAPLQQAVIGDVQMPLLVLLGAAGLILLMACSNVASLLLARATARTREMAIRVALGAGRARLVRQLLTESVLLGLAGGLAGLAATSWSAGALKAMLPASLPRIQEVAVNERALLFALAVAVLAGILFGLAPALGAFDGRFQRALKEGLRGAGEDRSHLRLRNALVVTEVALAVVLLAGEGLLLRSLLRLQSVNPGFDTRSLLTFGISLPRQRYAQSAQWTEFYRRLLDRLNGTPGVEGAAAVLPLPLSNSRINLSFEIAGRPPASPSERQSADYLAVSGSYFQLMQIPLVRGRLLTAADAADAPNVCVISEAFAKRYFPHENPIGESLIFGFTTTQARRRVVGVVANVKHNALSEPPDSEMYVPYPQDPWWVMNLAVRTVGDPAPLVNQLTEEVRELDPELAVDNVQPMSAIIRDTTAPERLRTILIGVFGALALVLAAIGIYGVLSYNVKRQAHDMGVRMALGAAPADVLRQVLVRGMWPVFVGIALGLAASVALAGCLRSLLFGIGPGDPLALAGAVSLLALVALLSCWIPARRASRVDPIVALRHE